MKSLNFGEIPDDLVINEPYMMQLNYRDLEMVANIINQGIDSHLQAIFTRQNGNTIWILDSLSMRCFLRRCMEASEQEQDFASCIMQTLNIEWI